jgi:ABC-2 type transport system permease protein
MMHMLQSELFRLRKRPQAWIMPVLASLFIAGYYVICYLSYRFGSAADRLDMLQAVRVDKIFANGMQVFGFVGGIMLVVVASGVIGSEFTWNTLRPLVARATSRAGLLSVKWITVGLYTVFMVLVGLVASILTAAGASLMMDVHVGLPRELWDDFLESHARWTLAMAAYPAVAFAVALLTKSNAAGIAIGIGVAFVEPLVFVLLSLVSGVFDMVQQYGIAWNVQQLTRPTTREVGFPNPVDVEQVWQSTGILVGYIAVLVAASFVVFNRRDITSG